MAVPSSGELKLWNDIWNNEIGGTQGENSLHSASVYAGFTTPDAMSDFYGWSDVEVPSVTTNSISSVGASSMQLNGTVNSTGNEDVSRGFYHGTNANASTNNTKYTLGGTQGTGGFSCSRTGLSGTTTYYAWAFACNSAGQDTGGRVQATTPFSPSVGSLFWGRARWGGGNAIMYLDYLNPLSGGYTNYNSSAAASPACNNSYVNNATNRTRGVVATGPTYDNICLCMQISANPGFSNVGSNFNGSFTSVNLVSNTAYRRILHSNCTYANVNSGINSCHNASSDIRLKTNINYL